MYSMTMSPAFATEVARQQTLTIRDESRRLRRARLASTGPEGPSSDVRPVRRVRAAVSTRPARRLRFP